MPAGESDSAIEPTRDGCDYIHTSVIRDHKAHWHRGRSQASYPQEIRRSKKDPRGTGILCVPVLPTLLVMRADVESDSVHGADWRVCTNESLYDCDDSSRSIGYVTDEGMIGSENPLNW